MKWRSWKWYTLSNAHLYNTSCERPCVLSSSVYFNKLCQHTLELFHFQHTLASTPWETEKDDWRPTGGGTLAQNADSIAVCSASESMISAHAVRSCSVGRLSLIQHILTGMCGYTSPCSEVKLSVWVRTESTIHRRFTAGASNTSWNTYSTNTHTTTYPDERLGSAADHSVAPLEAPLRVIVAIYGRKSVLFSCGLLFCRYVPRLNRICVHVAQSS